MLGQITIVIRVSGCKDRLGAGSYPVGMCQVKLYVSSLVYGYQPSGLGQAGLGYIGKHKVLAFALGSQIRVSPSD